MLVLFLLFLFFFALFLLFFLLFLPNDQVDNYYDKDNHQNDDENYPPSVVRALLSTRARINWGIDWAVFAGTIRVSAKFTFLSFARTIWVGPESTIFRFIFATSIFVFAEFTTRVFSLYDVVLAGLRVESRFKRFRGWVSELSVSVRTS